MRYMYNWSADDNQTSFIERDWSFTVITLCINSTGTLTIASYFGAILYVLLKLMSNDRQTEGYISKLISPYLLENK